MDNNILIEYKKTKNILNDMREIIEVSRKNAYQAINVALVNRNWLLGKRIAEEEFNNKARAEYGMEIIKQLSEDLTKKYGKGFTKSNLYSFYSFYKLFPDIFHTVCGKFKLVFSGGTCLSKAYLMIKRFSEDIDLRIQESNNSLREERKKFVEQIFEV